MRRGRLPRPVVWLALLAAMVVAALGAAVTRSLPERMPNTRRLPPPQAVRFVPGV
jgi:hypothetical protein